MFNKKILVEKGWIGIKNWGRGLLYGQVMTCRYESIGTAINMDGTIKRDGDANRGRGKNNIRDNGDRGKNKCRRDRSRPVPTYDLSGRINGDRGDREKIDAEGTGRDLSVHTTCGYSREKNAEDV